MISSERNEATHRHSSSSLPLPTIRLRPRPSKRRKKQHHQQQQRQQRWQPRNDAINNNRPRDFNATAVTSSSTSSLITLPTRVLLPMLVSPSVSILPKVTEEKTRSTIIQSSTATDGYPPSRFKQEDSNNSTRNTCDDTTPIDRKCFQPKDAAAALKRKLLPPPRSPERSSSVSFLPSLSFPSSTTTQIYQSSSSRHCYRSPSSQQQQQSLLPSSLLPQQRQQQQTQRQDIESSLKRCRIHQQRHVVSSNERREYLPGRKESRDTISTKLGMLEDSFEHHHRTPISSSSSTNLPNTAEAFTTPPPTASPSIPTSPPPLRRKGINATANKNFIGCVVDDDNDDDNHLKFPKAVNVVQKPKAIRPSYSSYERGRIVPVSLLTTLSQPSSSLSLSPTTIITSSPQPQEVVTACSSVFRLPPPPQSIPSLHTMTTRSSSSSSSIIPPIISSSSFDDIVSDYCVSADNIADRNKAMNGSSSRRGSN